MQLGIAGFSFDDLQRPEGLQRLHVAFLSELRRDDPATATRFEQFRAAPDAVSAVVESEVLIAVAAHVSRFVGRLFNVETELAALHEKLTAELALFEFKREFVTRRVFKKGAQNRPTREELPALEAQATQILSLGFEPDSDRERQLARAVITLLHLEKTPDEATWSALKNRVGLAEATPTSLLLILERWIFATASFTHRFAGWSTITQPRPLITDKLVELHVPDASLPEGFEGPPQHLRRRDGFGLTDPRGDARLVMGEVDYCVICHEREKDSCSTGFKEKDPVAAGTTFKKNALQIPLAGCPLEEHISEMHALKARGDSLGALAMVILDNPMCPGTGHRICNDCMKACIFQKQEPVNIPQIETSVLTDVLALPYGFEIYGLLTRWNPLNVRRPHAAKANGKNVLVVGLGPAGYTLAHYLMNEGFTVVGIDGLKIEHFPDSMVRAGFEPIRDWKAIASTLDTRVLEGFGGVSEYGITVRWDKSFLTLIHLTLARRDALRIYGGIRFGGTLTIDDAWRLGFDHIAIAAGAGKPTIVSMKNNLLRGVRAASDFLMALQLTGAFKRDSLANLQVRLPAVVIGGGLTGVDTATELFAYYPVQVEKVLARHEVMAKHAAGGEAAIFAKQSAEENQIYTEFLEHGRAIRAERARALAANEAPDFVPLIRGWGGVSLCYRRGLVDSPAYRLNHEEVAKALEEGIRFIEKVSPTEAISDEFGAVKALRLDRKSGGVLELPARTVCVAAGTSPNVTYEREYPGTFALDEDDSFFRNFDAVSDGNGGFTLKETEAHDDIGREVGFFTNYTKDNRFITFYGDNHPTYAGNVVKAMASAKDGFPHVSKLFANADGANAETIRRTLFERLDAAFLASVEAVNRLTPNIVEVIVKAPFAAQHFEPGQFYRLQNFERSAEVIDGTRLTMEGLALTGAWVDKEKGLLSTIVLEMGASSRLCALLKKGERVVLMGPTGTPTHITSGETVLLAGGGLGNAVLFSIGQALRAHGSKVLYFAGYKKAEDAYKFDDLERAADQVIWSVDAGTPLSPRRAQDRAFVGNIVQSIMAYANGELGSGGLELKNVDRIIAIGSDRMMKAVKDARHGVLEPHLKRNHSAIGSINSPMQCMMKEICAQCLQRHVDARTGKEHYVFSCFNQDQDLDSVDFAHLEMRLKANSVIEKQTDQFLSHLLQRGR